MADKRYRIISVGTPLKGYKDDEVLKNLSALFKTPPEKTRQLLAGRPALVKGGMDEQKARKLFNTLKKAGLTCKALMEDGSPAEGQEPERAGRQPSTSAPAPAPSMAAATDAAPNVQAAMRARTMDPPMGQVTIEHTAIQCNEITSSSQGLNFHRPGLSDVPLTDITMISVYQIPTSTTPQLKLMIFLKESRRPMAINAQSIKYWTFDGLTTKSVNLSLRQFIAHAYAHNPKLIMDTPTINFLSNALPRTMQLDESILASAFGRVLDAEGLFTDEPAAEEETFGPDMTDTLKALKTAAAAEFNPEKHARPRIWLAMTTVATTMAFGLWVMTEQLSLLRTYKTYFSAARHPILNHLLLWPSVLGAIVIIALATHVLILLKRHSSRAPGMLNTYAILFVLYSALRFVTLTGLAFAIRKGYIIGALAVFELPGLLNSKDMILDALLISPLLIALPLAYILMRIFSYNYAVRSEFLK